MKGAFLPGAGTLTHSPAFQSLFVPSLAHFDFVVHLEPAVISRYLDHVAFDEDAVTKSQARLDRGRADHKSKYRNFQPTNTTIVTDLNVGQEFVQLLESLYSDTMRLYYDGLGGVVVGGLFNPSLSRPRAFRVGLGFNSEPSDDKGKDVVLNRKDVLAEIERLGNGIVQKIEYQARE
jgi:U3 small nucleolar RNA-associated protein 22